MRESWIRCSPTVGPLDTRKMRRQRPRMYNRIIMYLPQTSEAMAGEKPFFSNTSPTSLVQAIEVRHNESAGFQSCVFPL